MHRLLMIAGLLLAACGPVSSTSTNSAAAFVGTWHGTENPTVTCGMNDPVQGMYSGVLVIAQGSDSSTITAVRPDGCHIQYTVDRTRASASQQTCGIEVNGQSYLDTIESDVLELASGGRSLFEQGTGTQTALLPDGGTETLADGGGGTCSLTIAGAFAP